jgi:hypothetical protein
MFTHHATTLSHSIVDYMVWFVMMMAILASCFGTAAALTELA